MKLPQNITLVIIYYPHDDGKDISLCEIHGWLLSIVQLLFYVLTSQYMYIYIYYTFSRYTFVFLLYRAN